MRCTLSAAAGAALGSPTTSTAPSRAMRRTGRLLAPRCGEQFGPARRAAAVLAHALEDVAQDQAPLVTLWAAVAGNTSGEAVAPPVSLRANSALVPL